MRCKKIQELLKADYLDNEINQMAREHIKEHLKECSPCRRLEEELQAQRALFQKAQRLDAPGHVWQNIRDTIIAEQLDRQRIPAQGILQRLKESLWLSPQVFALSSAVIVIAFTVAITSGIVQKQQSLSKEDPGETIAAYSLNGENDDLFYNMGTNVEEYFL